MVVMVGGLNDQFCGLWYLREMGRPSQLGLAAWKEIRGLGARPHAAGDGEMVGRGKEEEGKSLGE